MLAGLIFKFKLLKNYFDILYKQYRDGNEGEVKIKKVFFDLTERNAGRYYYALIFFFYQAGYKIYINNNFNFIASCVGDGKRIFSIPGLTIINRVEDETDIIYISDWFNRKYASRNWKKLFAINFDIYSYINKDNHLWLPYPMSPANYVVGKTNEEKVLRSRKRSKGIFFSGNTNKEAYTNPIINTFFKKVNRFEIIESIKNNLSVDELTVIDHNNSSGNKKDLIRNMVLVDWQWSPQSSSNLAFRVNNEHWLASLAESNFFLACPGVTMPMCHNIIEAMGVGTIPITEYPEYFNPPLVHYKNCIVYKGKDDLILKIREVLQLDANQINMLRANVILYYDQHLSSQSFIEKVENLEIKNNVLFMNGENVSYFYHSKNKLPYS